MSVFVALGRRQDEPEAPGNESGVLDPTTSLISVSSDITFSGDAPEASTSTSPPSPSASAAADNQSIPTRTLIAVCVGAFVLLAGLVIFVLWFGARSKKRRAQEQLADGDTTHGSLGDEMKLKGLHSTNGGGVIASRPPQIPVPRAGQNHNHDQYSLGSRTLEGGYDRDDDMKHQGGYAHNGDQYVNEESFLSLKPTKPSPPSSAPQSPRSASAQPITHPYTVGAHPFASPSVSHAPLYRPSFERTPTSTVAIANINETDNSGTGLGLKQTPSYTNVNVTNNGNNYNNNNGYNPPQQFVGAGARPGYDAYGFESRGNGTAVAPGSSGSVRGRPSIDSVRSIAKKGSASNLYNDVPLSAGGGNRPRKGSTSSSIYNQSQYAGSVRAGREAAKEKRTKEEKARELAAMENLIAALDENALAEKKRKETLVAAAGIEDHSRRKDVNVVGSYPLPPPEVFRAALGRPSEEVDDAEIEQWKRR